MCGGVSTELTVESSLITVALQIFLTSVTAVIDKTAEINYALVDDPTFTDTYILSRNKASLQQLCNKPILMHEALIVHRLQFDWDFATTLQ